MLWHFVCRALRRTNTDEPPGQNKQNDDRRSSSATTHTRADVAVQLVRDSGEWFYVHVAPEPLYVGSFLCSALASSPSPHALLAAHTGAHMRH